MHPHPTFRWADEAEMMAFVDTVSFATICVDGPAVVHVPVFVSGPGRIRFHVSRGNPAAKRFEGARAIASLLGPDAYISPDWYGTEDQVPTWNYLAVEAEGMLTRLPDTELHGLLDGLSALHEARLAPKPVWTSAKMSRARYDALLKGIIGFEMAVADLRGTRKLGQTKGHAEATAAADGLAATGRTDMADLMREAIS